jgi:hypothetical protein
MGVTLLPAVTLIGFGHTVRPHLSTIRQAEEIWAINNSHAEYGYTPDRIIAMDDLRRDEPIFPRYVREIISARVQVYTATAYPEWINTVSYPLADVIATLGLSKRMAQAAFSNTWCYALALAMHEGRKVVHCYGADFEPPDSMTDVEYARSRLKDEHPDWFVYYHPRLLRAPTEPGIHGFTFLLGVAHERGVAVHFAAGSTVMDLDRDAFFYGYSQQPEIADDT